jgi:hypothetical protein
MKKERKKERNKQNKQTNKQNKNKTNGSVCVPLAICSVFLQIRYKENEIVGGSQNETHLQ